MNVIKVLYKKVQTHNKFTSIVVNENEWIETFSHDRFTDKEYIYSKSDFDLNVQICSIELTAFA